MCFSNNGWPGCALHPELYGCALTHSLSKQLPGRGKGIRLLRPRLFSLHTSPSTIVWVKLNVKPGAAELILHPQGLSSPAVGLRLLLLYSCRGMETCLVPDSA